MASLGLKMENVKVVYDGVAQAFKEARPNMKRQDIVVCLGKLRKYKRIDHALIAFQSVLCHVKKPCRLVIAGKISEIDRGYLGGLQRLADKLGIAENAGFMLFLQTWQSGRFVMFFPTSLLLELIRFQGIFGCRVF